MTIIRRCHLCASDRYLVRYRFPKFDVLECLDCGLRRRSLKLTKVNLKKLYSRPYFTKEQKEYFAPCLKDIQKEDDRIKEFTERLLILGSLVPKPGKLLDIGCATGTFMPLSWLIKINLKLNTTVLKTSLWLGKNTML